MSEERVHKEPRATGGAEGVGPVIAEYRSAQQYRRWVLRLMVLVILIIIAVGFYRFYVYGRGVYTEIRSPATQQAMLDRVEREIYPKIKLQAERLSKTLAPQLVDMAKEKAREVQPEVSRAFEQQRKIFEQNVTQMLQDKGSAFMSSIVEEHKEGFQEKFPDIGDPIKMANLLELLVTATRDVAVKVFLDRRLDPHLEIIKGMQAKFRMLPVRDETDKELLNRAGEIAWELWVIKTSKGGAPEGAVPAATR